MDNIDDANWDGNIQLPEAVASFVTRLKALDATADREAFFALAGEFDNLLQNQTCWVAIFNSLLRAFVEKKSSDFWQNRRLLISASATHHCALTTGDFELGGTTKYVEANRDFLANTGSHLMIGFLGEEPVKVNRFRLPAGADFDVFDPKVKLEFVGTEMVAPRTRVNVDGCTDIVEFDVAASTVGFMVGSAWTTSQIWSIAPDTLQPVGASMTSIESSKIIAMLEELKRTSYGRASGEVAALCSHPDHNVRWAAMKCLGAIDADAVRIKLHEALTDSHPHVRNAAKANIQRINQEEQAC